MTNCFYDVFISYSHKDTWVRDWLLPRLEDAGLKVCIDYRDFEIGKAVFQNITDSIRNSRHTLAICSPNWVESQWTHFEALLLQTKDPTGLKKKMLPLMYQDCELPEHLEIFTWADFRDPASHETELKRVLNQIGAAEKEQPSGEPSPTDQTPQPKSKQLFVGRERELQTLIDGFQKPGSVQTVTGRLFQLDGAGGVGKTTLARQARNLCRDRFPDGCYEFDMTRTTPSAFAGQMARRLNLEMDEAKDEREAQQHISRMLQDRYALILLDNLTDRDAAQWLLPDEGPSCFIITTRNREIGKALKMQRRDVPITSIHLEAFHPDEALELFREVLDEDYRTEQEADYLALAERLGFMPIALRLALNLMIFPPRWSAERIREEALSRLDNNQKLSDLRTLEAVFNLTDPYFEDEKAKEVLRLLAQCAPGPVPLSFLQRLHGADADHLEMLLEELCSWSWCDSVEGEEKAFELHVLVREVVQNREEDPELSERFLSLVQQVYTEKMDQTHFTLKDRWLPQAEEAVRRLACREDVRLKCWVYWTFGEYCKWRGHGETYLTVSERTINCFPDDRGTRAYCYNNQALILEGWGKLEEAMALHKKSKALKEALGDRAGLARSYANQALILEAWGKLKEAMALHKKDQALNEALGNRAGLARSYGNQAVILSDWGKLEEAMALHKKGQAIYEALDDRAGLATIYGNQALILRAWGKLEEAMALHKKEQALEEALGNRAGLATSYANQALILSDWGKLEEAMALHEKEQAHKEELGNRAGLARSYGNQALILKAWGKLEEAMALHKKEQAIATELGDQGQLARSYANQALILSDWGKLEEAMALHKKEQGINEELGNRAGLGISFWNQGGILAKQGDAAGAIDLLRRAFEIRKALGIPTDDMEKDLAEFEAGSGLGETTT
ncbi:MAG: TIR domain-containing protein [Acidobacteriota bacterium]|nr:TIR domain-containing protein [Acidobacteriota bacterium]